MRQNLQIFASPASSSPEILPIGRNFGKRAICQNRVSSAALVCTSKLQTKLPKTLKQ
jgi:hypothetical protein